MFPPFALGNATKATGKASPTQSVPKFALRAIGAPARDVGTEVPEQAQLLHKGGPGAPRGDKPYGARQEKDRLGLKLLGS